MNFRHKPLKGRETFPCSVLKAAAPYVRGHDKANGRAGEACRGMARAIPAAYRKLFRRFGPQRWWPADSAFEVMVGAILTQNTSWSNVEKAVTNLKRRHRLSADAIWRMGQRQLAGALRPAGYYNLKAARLKNFLYYFRSSYGGSARRMAGRPASALRAELLAVNGIGPETADSILLYALKKPVFVVDAYTRRILLRHRLIRQSAGYDEIQRVFMNSLEADVRLFNEYHALLVRLGKDHCLKNNPRCSRCPLANNGKPPVHEK